MIPTKEQIDYAAQVHASSPLTGRYDLAKENFIDGARWALKVVCGELIAEPIKQFLIASDDGCYPMGSICAKEHPELNAGSYCWRCNSHTWITDGCGETSKGKG